MLSNRICDELRNVGIITTNCQLHGDSFRECQLCSHQNIMTASEHTCNFVNTLFFVLSIRSIITSQQKDVRRFSLSHSITPFTRLHAKELHDIFNGFVQGLHAGKRKNVFQLILSSSFFPRGGKIGSCHFLHLVSQRDFQVFQLLKIKSNSVKNEARKNCGKHKLVLLTMYSSS
jgi:hypothetical protein